jgi:hypothetical protein
MSAATANLATRLSGIFLFPFFWPHRPPFGNYPIEPEAFCWPGAETVLFHKENAMTGKSTGRSPRSPRRLRMEGLEKREMMGKS